MPLVAHNDLPTFKRLSEEGFTILPEGRALSQDIRELHIGLLNMMPDAALQATERQFFRLIGNSNQIAQIYVHPFCVGNVSRDPDTQAYIDEHYESFDTIKEQGLDALIITGANEDDNHLNNENFTTPVKEAFEWAKNNVAATLFSCIATHVYMALEHNQIRNFRDKQVWGIYKHRVLDRAHPLVKTTNTIFDAPHARWGEVTEEQFKSAGIRPIVTSEKAGVHMAVSQDGFRQLFFQGHPEYDSVSLLKEYAREIKRYIAGEREDYPPYPANYFSSEIQTILAAHKESVEKNPSAPFPEKQITALIDNTWRDSAKAVIGSWIGAVYRTTHIDRKKQFMDGINPDDPLGIKTKSS